MQPRQATCIAMDGCAILIEGPPGSGKSSLALTLLGRGAALVGDDGVMLEGREDRLVAFPHPNTRGLLEVRNLGIVNVADAGFAICDTAPVCLVVALDEASPRYVEQPDRFESDGCAVPMVRLWPDSAALCDKVLVALRLHGLPPG
jgi:serine kinase of HPr protein (carbohydrate metabolism regulator)